VAQLSELLWVERRLAFDVLPEVIESVHDDALRVLFQQHLGETKTHVERVESAFRELGMEPSSAFSPGFSGLIEQHDTLTKKIVEPQLADQWHARAGIAVEHFELALYAGVEGLDSNRADEAKALENLVGWVS
jgi:ferritin-like metal-binding protein YciE